MARWYRKAADLEHLQAQLVLARFHEHSVCVPKDLGAAARWFQKAAEHGNKEAQDELWRCYVLGDGVPTDPKQGVPWLRKAADQGDAVGQSRLGACLEQDVAAAARWLRKAAAQERPEACARLARLIDAGKALGAPAAATSRFLRAPPYPSWHPLRRARARGRWP
mmetsp:Transcript_18637/g.62465  ORF Transcript_18637/g.62465 Transcript_18637/m.62465 type:complete len:165 (-) Transcript_18637:490-984(-)